MDIQTYVRTSSIHTDGWISKPTLLGGLKVVLYILAYKSQNLRQNHAPKVRGRLIRGS